MKRNLTEPNFYLGLIVLLLGIALLYGGHWLFGILSFVMWYVLWEDKLYGQASVFDNFKRRR